MKCLRLTSALLLASAALLSGCNRSHDDGSAVAGAHQWLDDFTRAFQARDTKAVMALYSSDILAYDLVAPLQYKGADAYGKDFDTFFSQYKGPLAIEYRDCGFSGTGDLAMITCLEHVSGTLTNGQHSSIWLRATSGLRRVNGRWLDFHDHISVPVDIETGKALLDLKP